MLRRTWWYNAHLREGNGLVGAGAITTIESLAGRYSGRWRLMGILSEAEYGLHYIEDPTGRLLVDLSHAVLLSVATVVLVHCFMCSQQHSHTHTIHTESEATPTVHRRRVGVGGGQDEGREAHGRTDRCARRGREGRRTLHPLPAGLRFHELRRDHHCTYCVRVPSVVRSPSCGCARSHCFTFSLSSSSCCAGCRSMRCFRRGRWAMVETRAWWWCSLTSEWTTPSP